MYNDYIIYSNQRCNFFRFSLIPAPVSRQSARITSIATMHGILWVNHAMSHSAMQHHAIPNLKNTAKLYGDALVYTAVFID